jgi:hypothetical protein
MQKQRRLAIVEYSKLLVTGLALAGLLVLTAAPRGNANEAECQHRTERADHRLHDAVANHGWDSRQAAHARAELQSARDYCWSQQHKWWDVESHQWHSDHDWQDDHGRP